MIIHLTSNDPNDYAHLRIQTSIGKLHQTVRYRVVSVSTIASFSVTTPSDYLIIKCEGVSMRFVFPEHGPYDVFLASEIVHVLTLDDSTFDPANPGQILPINYIDITSDTKGLLRIEAEKDFELVDASHRAKMLLGLYHSKLPLRSENKMLQMESFPLACLGNILYLVPRTDAVCVTNARGREETHSIVYKLNEILYNGFPVISKTPGEWYTIQLNELQTMEFVLTDFMLEPVILHAPLNVSIEIEPIGVGFV